MKQEFVFWDGEGDAWFDRNQDSPLQQIVIDEYTKLEIKDPECIVEIGCGTGRYLNEMEKYYDCQCYGFDPSEKAIDHGKKQFRNLHLNRGSMMAAYNTFRAGSVDVIVFGFCLYLFDRANIFSTIAWADEMLKENGHIIVHDFDPPEPIAVPYHHKNGVKAYKMNYPSLWLANPSYALVSKTLVRDQETVTIIKKGKWA